MFLAGQGCLELALDCRSVGLWVSAFFVNLSAHGVVTINRSQEMTVKGAL